MYLCIFLHYKSFSWAIKLNKKLEILNQTFREKSPLNIIKWGIENSKRPIITTNFRPYEAAILHLCIQVKPDINVIWCDTGYNTKPTYIHAEKLIKELKLNISIYVPKKTKEHRDVYMDGIPNIDSPLHSKFTEEVKLEPFRRAMMEKNPDLWITNLRIGQTTFRDSIDILSEDQNRILKMSPFYYWSDKDLDEYMKKNNLENEFDYHDPTKVEGNRECGLHGKI